MVDKIVEMDLIAAKKLVEEIEEVYLDLGITTLNEQLPYFLELMQKYRLNHNNPDHLKMVRDSLEARLNPITDNTSEELAVIDSGQPLDMLQEFDFESYFLEECGRVKNELAEIHREYIETKTPKFGMNLFLKDGVDYFRVIEFSGSGLIISEGDCRDTTKKWDTYNCLHGLFSININKVIIGHSCAHMGDNKAWRDYDQVVRLAYKYYFETTDSIDITKSFKLYFDIFRKLPEEIRKCASPSIIKKDAEEKMNQLQNARQEIMEYYLGKAKL